MPAPVSREALDDVSNKGGIMYAQFSEVAGTTLCTQPAGTHTHTHTHTHSVTCTYCASY